MEKKEEKKNQCMHYINFLEVRTRGRRLTDEDRSPPPSVEVECKACGGRWWYGIRNEVRRTPPQAVNRQAGHDKSLKEK